MAATRAAAMWPAVLIGSTGWPARWGAGVGVVFVSASYAGALPVQAVASRQIARAAMCLRVVMRASPGDGSVWLRPEKSRGRSRSHKVRRRKSSRLTLLLQWRVVFVYARHIPETYATPGFGFLFVCSTTFQASPLPLVY